MRLQDVMTHPVETIEPDQSADEAWNRMRIGGFHHLVVKEGGRVLGVLSDRDLGGSRGAALRRGHSAGELMSAPVVTASSRTTVRQAANLLRGRFLGCLPVVNGRRLVGIVTIADLLELVGRGRERAVVQGKRWTLKHRGPKHKRSYQHVGGRA